MNSKNELKIILLEHIIRKVKALKENRSKVIENAILKELDKDITNI